MFRVMLHRKSVLFETFLPAGEWYRFTQGRHASVFRARLAGAFDKEMYVAVHSSGSPNLSRL